MRSLNRMNIHALFVVFGAILWTASTVLAASPVGGFDKNHPIIMSYFWPVENGTRDYFNLNMSTPNVIDLLPSESHGNESVRQYWSEKGKILLSRVNAMRFKGKGDLLYAQIAMNMEKFEGVSIDEFVEEPLTKNDILIFSQVLEKVRKNYPNKYVYVWGVSVWKDKGIPLLRAIRDYTDVFVPELYFSEEYAASHGLGAIKERLERLERQAPGILEKSLFGMGVYKKMGSLGSESFRRHMEAQIRFVTTDALLKSLRGIAIYAPCYLPKSDQQYLDGLIHQYYLKEPLQKGQS